MNPREVCFLIGNNGAVLWSDVGSSAVAIPDSRARWEAIWRWREELGEVVHTHPLGGAHFSSTDETTMRALDAALGRNLRYSVVTDAEMIRREPGTDGHATVAAEPWWADLIRLASGIVPPTKET